MPPESYPTAYQEESPFIFRNEYGEERSRLYVSSTTTTAVSQPATTIYRAELEGLPVYPLGFNAMDPLVELNDRIKTLEAKVAQLMSLVSDQQGNVQPEKRKIT